MNKKFGVMVSDNADQEDVQFKQQSQMMSSTGK